MKKVLIFLVIVGGIALFEPRSREQIIGLIPSLSAATHQRRAERAVRQIALDVKKDGEETGTYPRSKQFEEWLRENRHGAEDPWGASYYFELHPDSFVVGSRGPDNKKRSADDIRQVKYRGPKAAHLQPGYSPPAPPPSGVKNSAMQNAKKAASRGEN
jgi:hypothetical protein